MDFTSVLSNLRKYLDNDESVIVESYIKEQYDLIEPFITDGKFKDYFYTSVNYELHKYISYRHLLVT